MRPFASPLVYTRTPGSRCVDSARDRSRAACSGWLSDKLAPEYGINPRLALAVILAVFDGSLGCQEGDRDVAELLRRYDKQVYYIVNKCDGEETCQVAWTTRSTPGTVPATAPGSGSTAP